MRSLLQREDIPLDLEAAADRACYAGSPEHKQTPSFAGRPRPRADASICDKRFLKMQEQLSAWLKEAIRRGHVGAPWEGHFPRYVWFKLEDVVYEARLVNQDIGQYKGYPLERDEWPTGI